MIHPIHDGTHRHTARSSIYSINFSCPENDRGVITLHMGILLKSKDYLKSSYQAETLSLSEPENVVRMLDVARYRYQASAFKDALA